MTEHFVQRAKERGPEGINAELLRDEIRQAVRDGYNDYVQPVKKSENGMTYYRFRIADVGIYYALCASDGSPVTFFTHEQYRKKRFALKRSRKGLVRPGLKTTQKA